MTQTGRGGAERTVIAAGSHTGRMLRRALDPRAESRQVRGDQFAAYYLDGKAIQPPLDPEKLLTLYEQHPVHAACINARADDATGDGWFLERESDGADGDGGADPDLERRLRDRLEELTPEFSFAELLHQAVRDEGAIGWGAWEITRAPGPRPRSGAGAGPGTHRRNGSPFGDVAGIYPVPAHTIRATPDRDVWVQVIGGRRRYFARFGLERPVLAETGEPAPEGAPAERLASELIIFRTYSARSPWYGLPQWISAIPALAELTAIREFNVAWFASNGMADRLIHVRAESEATAERLRAEIERGLNESRGRGYVSILTAGSKDTEALIQFFQPGGTRARDGAFGARRDALVKEVLMAHRTPPYRIGLAELGSLAGNAAREMLRTYQVGNVGPAQRVMEDRLNATLFGPGGLDLQGFRFRLRPIDITDLELELRIADVGVGRGFLTPNEARQRLGEPPRAVPALDTFRRDPSLALDGEDLDSLAADPAPPTPAGTASVPAGSGRVDEPSSSPGTEPVTESTGDAAQPGAAAQARGRRSLYRFRFDAENPGDDETRADT